MSTARHTGRRMRYYDPGQNPQPRRPEKATPERKPKAKRPGDALRLARAEAKRDRRATLRRNGGQP